MKDVDDEGEGDQARKDGDTVGDVRGAIYTRDRERRNTDFKACRALSIEPRYIDLNISRTVDIDVDVRRLDPWRAGTSGGDVCMSRQLNFTGLINGDVGNASCNDDRRPSANMNINRRRCRTEAGDRSANPTRERSRRSLKFNLGGVDTVKEATVLLVCPARGEGSELPDRGMTLNNFVVGEDVQSEAHASDGDNEDGNHDCSRSSEVVHD